MARGVGIIDIGVDQRLIFIQLLDKEEGICLGRLTDRTYYK